MSNEWQIFTDGGSRGNPGQAACAFSVQSGGVELFHQSRFLGVMTNNEAEYWGMIDSVEFVLNQINQPNPPSNLIWQLDSKLVVEQILGNWKIKEARLKPMVEKVQDLLSQLPSDFAMRHVYREQNARADQLVNECLDANAHLSLTDLV